MERIAHLPDEERAAILFLLTGDELEHNFDELISSSSGLRVSLHTHGTAILVISNMERMLSSNMSHIYYESLGGGYGLWIYARAPRGSEMPLRQYSVLVVFALLSLFAVVDTAKTIKREKMNSGK